MLVLAFFSEGFDQSREQAPSPSLFSLTPICISPHIGKLLRASKGDFFGAAWVSLNVKLKYYPGDFGGNPPLFSRLAQVQPAVKSLGFWYSLWIRMVDYGYMCMIHEHTAVFSITDPTASQSSRPFRGRVRSGEALGEWGIVSLRCSSELFCPPFFL